jgi:hypothetical protein
MLDREIAPSTEQPKAKSDCGKQDRKIRDPVPSFGDRLSSAAVVQLCQVGANEGDCRTERPRPEPQKRRPDRRSGSFFPVPNECEQSNRGAAIQQEQRLDSLNGVLVAFGPMPFLVLVVRSGFVAHLSASSARAGAASEFAAMCQQQKS